MTGLASGLDCKTHRHAYRPRPSDLCSKWSRPDPPVPSLAHAYHVDCVINFVYEFGAKTAYARIVQYSDEAKMAYV